MPTYEYACDACKHSFEREQRITEDPIKKCPKCGKAKARRMIAGGSFILKGSGWYADLYHKPAAAKSGGSDSSASSSSTSDSSSDSSSSKSESKADSSAKPETKKKSKKAAS